MLVGISCMPLFLVWCQVWATGSFTSVGERGTLVYVHKRINSYARLTAAPYSRLMGSGFSATLLIRIIDQSASELAYLLLIVRRFDLVDCTSGTVRLRQYSPGGSKARKKIRGS